MSSSPAPPRADATLEEELAYYKSQYEQIDVELQEFQASSKELEEQLERDIEDSEKRERSLREKVEAAGFEIEEWKSKYKQSKTEAASAQGNLQKEITTLRDSNRTLNLKLRDIEVANDDFERQARNTTSSLEDLESKYNVAIERGVLLEEEIKVGEQEREALRIENQRVRDELNDLKIEAEILLGKLRSAEGEVEQLHQQRTASLMARPPTSDGESRPRTSGSDISTQDTAISSPTASTPPPTTSTRGSVTDTPPSPPLSDESRPAKTSNTLPPITPSPAKKRTPPVGQTPRANATTTRTNTALTSSTIKPQARHMRGPSVPMVTTTPTPRRTTGVPLSAQASHRPRPSISNLPAPTPRSRISGVGADTLPRSGSLYQIRGLITKMSKLEARVQNARSKLPGPTITPPRGSPRQASGLHSSHSATPSAGSHIGILPGNVTVRRSGRDRRSRASNSTATTGLESTTPSRPMSRLSFGVPTTAAHHDKDRPASALSHAGSSNVARPPSATGHSRPSSVASNHLQHGVGGTGDRFVRPGSRSSVSGARTPLGMSSSTTSASARPGSRTSSRISGSFNPSASVGHGYRHVRDASLAAAAAAGIGADVDEEEGDGDALGEMLAATPRRGTFGRSLQLHHDAAGGSGIPTPSGLPRRKSGGVVPLERRMSSGTAGTGISSGSGGGADGAGGPGGEMLPPASTAAAAAARKRLSEVGETY